MNVKTRLAAWLLLSFAGCAGQAEKPGLPAIQSKPATSGQVPLSAAKPDSKPLPTVGAHQAASISGDYAGYPALSQFIDDMVKKHHFSRDYLNGLFSQARRKQWTLDYLAKSDQGLKSKPAQGAWSRYRAQFLDDRHINDGIAFWRKHRSALQRARQQYGVPEEYILGIMAVETTFGSSVGNHRIIDALTTLAFDYPRRAEYFRSELENFLLMTRGEGVDPAKPIGSFAGAMGLGQFMPGSFLQWAVDFNGDGHKDLWNPEDAVGSIANYFAQHGWQAGQPVVSAIKGKPVSLATLEPGLSHTYSLSQLQQLGITLAPPSPCPCDHPLHLLMLRHHSHDQYLIGHPNFYVITRYNQSTHYAMAVHELAQAIRSGVGEIADAGYRKK
ncbi:MAG: lytic murein transglycosylase B [Methylomonas sp.]|nr:lytic murein transglycosylase B [Methylomonas sp.]PPD19935.1 MAG: lytic murein transglycosylase B [Methylomonas sp.]PPD25468.1 MAG: lytic murein transglycosylase B [Methylomonas sp.]PPD36168.1 MAG: lytic murein transglycosylase B [Methylomonas sp.]PPD39721.1 MAG: lytic murein transglycosylase B [Methylomonas sp.]